jgi:hypothetical protein
MLHTTVNEIKVIECCMTNNMMNMQTIIEYVAMLLFIAN